MFAASFAHLLLLAIMAQGYLPPTRESDGKVWLNRMASSSKACATSKYTSTALFNQGFNNGQGNEKYEESDEALFAALAQKKDAAVKSDARVPSPSLKPENIVPLIMNSLQNNDVPRKDAGLMMVWEFSTDTTKCIFKHNTTEFIESCHETANEFPTSFYGTAMNGRSWELETALNLVGGESGWIATQVMKTISSDGRMRRWQWELRKNKRPPCLGCWKVESIGSSDRNGDFEARDVGDGWTD
ncbi:hypothetical protein ACHAWF_013344 [Thalassiosira exigua]